MLSGMCQFLTDWSVADEASGLFEWLDVQGPDEYYVPVNNSAFTNYAAAQSIAFCIEAAQLLNATYPSQWDKIASSAYVPFDASEKYHPESDNYEKGQKVKQADVILLYFPQQMNESVEIQTNDLAYYESVSDPAGPAMTWAMFVVNWLQLGQYEAAMSNFAKSYLNIQPPFNVWTETADGGGSVNFITGAGGFLQQFVFGFSKMRIGRDALTLDFAYLAVF